jgi:hypothetical protein
VALGGDGLRGGGARGGAAALRDMRLGAAARIHRAATIGAGEFSASGASLDPFFAKCGVRKKKKGRSNRD